MSLYIYAPQLQQGTQALIDMLQAKGLRKHDGMHFLYKGTPIEFSNTDAIVCWGAHVPAPAKVPCLNANLKYTNLLSLNVRGMSALSSLGYTCLVPQMLSKSDYANSHYQEWPKQQTRTGYISIPELEGYGTAYYKFNERYEILLFEEQVLNGVKDGPAWAVAVKSLKHLGLNFARFYMGLVNGTPVIYKILSAPALSDEEVKLFAKHIAEWAKNVGEFNATAGKYEELIGDAH